MLHTDLDCAKFEGHGVIPDFFVPDSFIDDGASVPTILQPIIGKSNDPKFRSAARGHDWFYRGGSSKMELTDGDLRLPIAIRPSRKQADDWFLKELAYNGVGRVRRTVMYAGVRFFGAPFWKGRSDDIDFDLEAIKEALCMT